MKIPTKVTAVFLALAVLLAAYACGLPSTDASADTDMSCPTGVTAYSVPLTDLSGKGDALGGNMMDAYIVLPNEGCNLPAMYCLTLGDRFNAGPSCNRID